MFAEWAAMHLRGSVAQKLGAEDVRGSTGHHGPAEAEVEVSVVGGVRPVRRVGFAERLRPD